MDNGRPILLVAEEFFETHADDSAEIRPAVLEKLAEDDPRLTVPGKLVTADIVMYATDDAFVKATT